MNFACVKVFFHSIKLSKKTINELGCQGQIVWSDDVDIKTMLQNPQAILQIKANMYFKNYD
jgi:hypothetical protein